MGLRAMFRGGIFHFAISEESEMCDYAHSAALLN